MARKRIYEIARELGVPSREVLERLEQAGIEGKAPASTIEEEVALVALRGAGGEPCAAAPEEPPPPAPETRAPWPARWLRRWRLRRRLDAELWELGGWLLEMRRSGSRRDDLLEARLARA